MVLTLMKGESFENLKRQAGMTGQSYPYRRESFDRKQLIRDDLNAGFNRLDNSVMKDDYMSKLFYPAVFHCAEEGGFWISFPDFPDMCSLWSPCRLICVSCGG